MRINNLVKSSQKGFTLIEVLCAGAVITVGATVLIGGICLGVYALSGSSSKPTVERANVINGPAAELFIDKDGKRFYAEIDGKPIEQYLNKKR